MIKKQLELIINTGQAENALQGVDKSVNRIDKDLTKTEQEFSKINTDAKQLDSNLKKVPKATKKITGGFRAMGTALKAAGIGLVISGFALLKELFQENQKVVDVFNIAFESLSLAFNDFFNYISKNVETISSYFKKIFDDPLESVKALGNAIKDNIIERVQSLFDVFGHLGKTMKKLFSGDWDGALEEIKKAGSEMVDVMTGVDNSVEKVTEVVSEGVTALTEYTKSTYDQAKANVELKKKADLAAVANQGLIEKYDRQAEQQRQIRDDERKSIEDRKKANDELAVILDKQEKAMKVNANTQLQLAEAELKKDAKNVEALKAKGEALNELAAIEATVTGFRSEQKTNEAALEKEGLELINSRLESENNLAIERKRFDAEQIEDELEKLEKLKEIDAEEQEIEAKRLKDVINSTNVGTQARIDAEITYNEFLEDSRQKNLTRDKEIADKKVDVQDKMYDELYNAFWENANKVLQNDKEITDARIDLEDALVNATSSALSSIANLAGEGTKIAKVAAIADIIIGTGVGFIQGLDIAQKSAKATGPGAAVAFPIFYATQVAAVLSAAAQAKNVLSRAKGPQPPSVSPPSIGGGGAATSPTQPPSFNVVGQSGFNQVAGALGQQQPVQAYVVAGNVTTAQQLQNNTITTSNFLK